MTIRILAWAMIFPSAILWPQSVYRPEIPKTWDEAALKDWATPVAGLNVRPSHISEKEYYALAVENLRTYPVYYPGREPEGYWEMLQRVGPKPLIEPAKLKSEADWVQAGRKVFDEIDHVHLRTFDPRLIGMARNREFVEKSGMKALPDGTLPVVRWLPTKEGVALTLQNCRNCHELITRDGRSIPGAPTLAEASRNSVRSPNPFIGEMHFMKRAVIGATPFFMGPEPIGTWLYHAYGVPWQKDDIHEKLKSINDRAEYNALVGNGIFGGIVYRWNGSPYYPAKVPDLIGFKNRKYVDHTATHLHRNIGDFMRYTALVSYAEATDFGPHRSLGSDTRRAQARLPDEALYALALYIYSLEPPPNPNRFDESAKAGQKIFAREGCPVCHTPPLYTSNKLTLAQGFTPPEDKPASLDVIPISVGTDPGLALKTRKGTGYYKVPSLKGVWYRGHYLHDGSAASLEEMFDPDRLKATHVPGGWMPPGAKTHAIQGHEFGLGLAPEEREQLLAFLRTL